MEAKLYEHDGAASVPAVLLGIEDRPDRDQAGDDCGDRGKARTIVVEPLPQAARAPPDDLKVLGKRWVGTY